MSQQDKSNKSKLGVVFKRVRIWEGRPQPGGLKTFLTVGGSDSGRVEYDGSVLKFTGKKLTIDIPAIMSISEVNANMKFLHFLVYFISLVVFFLFINLGFEVSLMNLLISIAAALLLTVFSWWYLNKFGGWVWIQYTSFDGQQKDIGLWGAPLSGGTQTLYRNLATLISTKGQN